MLRPYSSAVRGVGSCGTSSRRICSRMPAAWGSKCRTEKAPPSALSWRALRTLHWDLDLVLEAEGEGLVGHQRAPARKGRAQAMDRVTEIVQQRLFVLHNSGCLHSVHSLCDGSVIQELAASFR